MRGLRWKLGASLTATGLVVAGFTQVASQAANADEAQLEGKPIRSERALAPNGVPIGFEPHDSSWTSNDNGAVLGTAPCNGNTFCTTLVSTTDGGATWTEEALPDSIGSPAELFTVAHDGATTRMVATYQGDGVAVYASYDGAAWQPEDFGESREFELTDLAVIDGRAHAGVARYGDTEDGTYYRAPVGKGQWEQVPEVTDEHIALIDFGASGSSAVAVHEYYSNSQVPTRIATTGDGSTWNVRKNPCGASNDLLTTWPSAANEQSLLLLCEVYDVRELKLLSSADGGATFDQSGSFGLPRGEIYDVAAYDETIGVAYREGRHGCDVALSDDNGTTWTRSMAEAGVGHDLQFTDAEHATVLCTTENGSDVFRTTDGGQTWQPLGLLTTGAVPDWLDPVSSSWTSSDKGYVLGWTPCAGQQYCAAMVATEDGGQTWTERPAPDLTWTKAGQKQAELFVAEQDGKTFGLIRYAPGDTTTNEAFASYDGGESWQPEDFGADDASTLLLDMSASSSYAYVLAEKDDGSGGPSAYSTAAYRAPLGTDDWKSFEPLSDPGTAAVDEINVRGDIGAAFVGGDYFDGPGPRLLSSADGAAWTEHQPPCDPNQRQTYLPAGGDRIFAFCPKEAGYIFPQKLAVSEDGGTTFAKVSDGPDKPVNLGGADAVGDTIVLGDFEEAVDSPGCTIRISTDGGKSYRTENLEGPGYDGRVTEVQLEEDGTGTAICVSTQAEGGGVVSRTTDGGQTWQALDPTG